MLYIRAQGRLKSGTFIHQRIGYNLQITDLQAAVGLIQMRKLPEIISRKLAILNYYKKHLAGISEIEFFSPDSNAEWLPFRVAILARSATNLMKYLKIKHIQPRTFFYPLHRQPGLRYLKKFQKLTDQDFPNATYGYLYGVCLPTYPTLQKDQLRYVVKTIKDFYEDTK